MLKALLKTRAQAMMNSMFARMRGGKQSKGKALLIALLAVYVVGALLFSFGSMLYAIAQSIGGTEMQFLLFVFTGIIGVLLSVIGSVFTTEKQLFDATDNELLLAMPIPPRIILFSRIAMLWGLNAVFMLFVLVPALFVYLITCTVSAAGIVTLILGIVLLPTFSLAVDCAVGWLVALISSKLRIKNLAYYVVLIAFFGVYLWFMTKANDIMGMLLTSGGAMLDMMRRFLPPVYWFAMAAEHPSPVAFLLLLLWNLLPMAIVYWLLSHTFISIVTTNRGAKKIVYREQSLKTATPGKALLARELRRFVTLPSYLINGGFGVVLELIFAGALAVKGPSITAIIPDLAAYKDILPLMIVAIASFMAVMTSLTAPSISLEGKRFWILRSLPVPTAEIFRAKLGANLLVGMPSLAILSIVTIFVLPMSAPMAFLVFLIPQMLQIFAAVFGLCANLWMPRFDWINEMTVVKQSGSVMVTIFGGMGLVMLGVIAYATLGSLLTPVTILSLLTVLIILIDAALIAYLFKKGIRLFEKL
ncbi:MAG: hypothetical protein VB111_08535 [Clostridiaceae bacterium]|nr:hypothetical protein [Clostridiaceae bacterium]